MGDWTKVEDRTPRWRVIAKTHQFRNASKYEAKIFFLEEIFFGIIWVCMRFMSLR